MDCICAHGRSKCALTPICLKAYADLSGVEGDLSKAKAFKDANGELGEELGSKHNDCNSKDLEACLEEEATACGKARL